MAYSDTYRIDKFLEEIGLPMNTKTLSPPHKRLEKAIEITRQEIHQIKEFMNTYNPVIFKRLEDARMRLTRLKDLQLNRFSVIRNGNDYGIYDHGLLIQTSHKILDEAAAHEAARCLNFLHTL